MLLKEYINRFFIENNISQVNQNTFLLYLDSFKTDKSVTDKTIRNNVMQMQLVLKTLNDEDLNALRKDSIKKYKIAVGNLTRKRDGKPASESTKKLHRVCFAQFLRWVAQEYDKPEYIKFADSLKIKIKTEGLKASDLLTKDEIDRMINIADNVRDQAILSVLIETGCREGEFVSSRISDVKQSNDFIFLTFRKGKTGPRTVPIKESIIYMNKWLEKHPYRDDPDAPLWVSKKLAIVKRGSKERAFTPVKEDTILKLVHSMATKAGIKKRVFPHLCRHTCATELAKDWSESMMRTYLGWEKGSQIPSRYTHLSGKDVEEAQRKRLGMVKDKEPEPLFKTCPRCKNEMPARVECCMICGEVFKNKATTLEDGMRAIVSDEIRSIVESMFYENPDKFDLIRSKLQPQK